MFLPIQRFAISFPPLSRLGRLDQVRFLRFMCRKGIAAEFRIGPTRAGELVLIVEVLGEVVEETYVSVST